MAIRKRIVRGQPIPYGYGVAHHEFFNNHFIAYPIPLNLIIQLFRWVYFNWLTFYKPNKIEKRIIDSFYEGQKVKIYDLTKNSMI